MNEMNALVVFYSRTGATRKAGEAVAGELKCDCEEIVDLRNRKGMLGYICSGMDAFLKRHTTIKWMENNLDVYDVVVIGTPVWAGRMAPAARTLINENAPKFRQVAFFCTMGGEESKRTFAEMEELCGKKPVATLALRASEVADGNYLNKVREFAKEIKS